ncbi:transposase [Nocardiopsis sp. MT53]|uniref:transposase n=1 Tax=Nocardiopsis sp. MT53 TaxID=2865672 RepID=UPI00210679A1|nr:transposase [Nocardiopsis sp. MT53]
MLADVDRKNSWRFAEHAGHRRAYPVEHLLDGARWGHDILTRRTRAHIRDHLANPEAVLVVDDTQVIEKGSRSVGVAYQYCGLTGQVENCQTLVTCTYAAPAGHAPTTKTALAEQTTFTYLATDTVRSNASARPVIAVASTSASSLLCCASFGFAPVPPLMRDVTFPGGGTNPRHPCATKLLLAAISYRSVLRATDLP